MNLKRPNKIVSKLKGLFAKSIPYEVRNSSGDWSIYFGTYEGQKYGQFDTSCCWDFAGCEVLEDQLMFLWKNGYFSPEAINFFKSNNYIDSSGEFYLSRRWCAILAGSRDSGNDQEVFWALVKEYGIIPDSMLPFSVEESQRWIRQSDFNNDYFNPALITIDMRVMGQRFLKYVSIAYEEVGQRWTKREKWQVATELKQAPLQIGIPIDDVNNWNSGRVIYKGGKMAVHSVELEEYNEVKDFNFPYFVYDQYEPHVKQLSRDYYIPMMTKAVVTAIPQIIPPIVPVKFWDRFYTSMHQYFVSIFRY